ncbi:hypothetical protein H2200_007499 [Cladophialophora chaetospira]|uniref:Polyprenal reductase n=1 Tax=Cladophialophora chaetospira TaxID=386627 RepID=A0AA38X813_9EURO|nr:hypothetical protein H2200_007499 [Cladophialophora chaetospira]
MAGILLQVNDNVLTLVWAIRAFYLLSAVAILTVRLLPAFAGRFLAYGARARPSQADNHRDNQSVGMKFLDYLATLTVPHSWFIHFYVLSSTCSLNAVCAFYFHPYYEDGTDASPSLKPAAFCAHLMLIQGLRRLFECALVTRAGPSRMWVGHYAIGVAFYMVTNMAIWVEQLYQPAPTTLWTWRTLLCTLVFFAASIKQNHYHRYLSSLSKYTLPRESAFRYIVAPHYTMECVIYLSLAILDAPVGHNGRPTNINWTLLSALAFVVVNLGVTADGTKEWEMGKFRDDSSEIIKRWKMIPWVH